MAFLAAASLSYLIVCFTAAAVTKLRDFAAFKAGVAGLVPGWPGLAGLASGAMVGAEIVVAAMFFASAIEPAILSRLLAAICALGLAAVFLAFIIGVLASGRSVRCHCFGSGPLISRKSLAGPFLVAVASLGSVLDAHWPAGASLKIASSAAGLYLMLLHWGLAHAEWGESAVARHA
jgi:hypothetical protein